MFAAKPPYFYPFPELGNLTTSAHCIVYVIRPHPCDGQSSEHNTHSSLSTEVESNPSGSRSSRNRSSSRSCCRWPCLTDCPSRVPLHIGDLYIHTEPSETYSFISISIRSLRRYYRNNPKNIASNSISKFEFRSPFTPVNTTESRLVCSVNRTLAHTPEHHVL